MYGTIARLALAAMLSVGGHGATLTSSHGAVHRLAWSDDFNGPTGSGPDARIWSAEIGGGGWGNEELESYTGRTSNAALDGQGHLVITARRETYTGPDNLTRQWTSARLMTRGKRTFHYGRLVVRMKVPASPGIWPAAWTLGSNIDQVGWPACGEIDLVEAINTAPEVYQTVHGSRAGARDWADGRRTVVSNLSQDFHSYAVDWLPGRIVFSVDGIVTKEVNPSNMAAGGTWPFDGPQYVLLDLAVGGNWAGAPTEATPSTVKLIVDSVKVYRLR